MVQRPKWLPLDELMVRQFFAIGLPLGLVVALLLMGAWQNSQQGQVRCAIPQGDPLLAAYVVALRAVIESPVLLGEQNLFAASIESAAGAHLPAGLLFHLRCNMLEWEWNYAGVERSASEWRLTLGGAEPRAFREGTIYTIPLSIRLAGSTKVSHWNLSVTQRGNEWTRIDIDPRDPSDASDASGASDEKRVQ